MVARWDTEEYLYAYGGNTALQWFFNWHLWQGMPDRTTLRCAGHGAIKARLTKLIVYDTAATLWGDGTLTPFQYKENHQPVSVQIEADLRQYDYGRGRLWVRIYEAVNRNELLTYGRGEGISTHLHLRSPRGIVPLIST